MMKAICSFLSCETFKFVSLIVSVLFFSVLLPNGGDAATVTADLVTRAKAGVFPIGETVQVKFRVVSGAGTTLTVTVRNQDNVTVWGPATYAVVSGDWSSPAISMPSSLGFYRVWASIPGASISAKGTRPAGYITYAVVPDPLQRPLYPDTESFFGLQGGFNQNTDRDILALLGIRWTNRGKEWDRLEPNFPGQYTGAARSVEATWATNGKSTGAWRMYLMPNLMRKPTNWDPYKPGTSGHVNIGALNGPANETAWTNFCRNMAKGYKDAGSYGFMARRVYELTWEPMRSWGFYLGTDADFSRIYELGAAAIRAEDPDAIVLGPANVLDRASWMNDTFNYLSAGMKNHVDGLSMHPYVYNRGLPERYGLRHQLNQFKWRVNQIAGKDFPMYGTEQGADTSNAGQNGNDYTRELEHALKIVRSNLVMLGEGWKVNLSYWIHDYTGEAGAYGMGFFYNLNLGINYGTDQIGPKTVVAAYSAMTWLLEGHRSTATIDYLDNEVLGYAYGRNGSTILALWKFNGVPAQFVIPTGMPSATLDTFDWLGRKTSQTTNSSGDLTLTLTNTPLYVKGVSQSLWGIDRQNYNIARGKPTITGGDHNSATYPGAYAVDGNNAANGSRWISAANASANHWIVVDLQQNYQINEIRFWVGEHQDGNGNYHIHSVNALDKYKLEYWNGSAYQLVPGTDKMAGGNKRAAVQHRFSPLSTSKVRLLMGTPWSTSKQIKLYEIEVMSTTPAGGGAITAWSEDFSSISNGALLQNVSGWSKLGGGASDAKVLTSAGHADQGIASTNATAIDYTRSLTATGEQVTHSDGTVTFTANIKFSGDDRYNDLQLDLGESSTTNRFVVRLLSAATNGGGDNQVQVSNGDDGGGAAMYTTFGPGNTWTPNVWYTVEISNVNLSSTLPGKNVSGTFKLVETATGTVKIQSPITALGSSASDPFGQIDFFRFDRLDYGASGEWCLDDLQLAADP